MSGAQCEVCRRRRSLHQALSLPTHTSGIKAENAYESHAMELLDVKQL